MVINSMCNNRFLTAWYTATVNQTPNINCIDTSQESIMLCKELALECICVCYGRSARPVSWNRIRRTRWESIPEK